MLTLVLANAMSTALWLILIGVVSAIVVHAKRTSGMTWPTFLFVTVVSFLFTWVCAIIINYSLNQLGV